MSLPAIPITVTLTSNALTLVHKDQTGEFFVNANGEVDLWALDEWISKVIAHEADKEDLRQKLSGK